METWEAFCARIALILYWFCSCVPPAPLFVLTRLRMPVTCSSRPWRSFGRSRLGLRRWEISNSSSWILGQEVWKNTPSSENLGQISLEPSSSPVSEYILCAHPQSSHSSILLPNHPVLVHKLSKGRNHASSVLVARYLCAWTTEDCIYCEVQDSEPRTRVTDWALCLWHAVLSLLWLCVQGSSLARPLHFSRETEKSEFYMK